MITQEEYNDAIGRVDADDWTKGNKSKGAGPRPKLDALNAVLADMDLPSITGEEREMFWRDGMEEVVGKADGFDVTNYIPVAGDFKIENIEALKPEKVTVTIVDAPSNPVSLHVHGVGSWVIYHGATVELPAEAVAALENSNVTFLRND